MDVPGFDVLLDRARSGDEDAFAALYRDLQPRLLRYLQVQAPDRAEDAAADTWLEVARSLGSFTGDESGFRSWVFTIARSRLVDGFRRDARRPVRLVDEEYELELLAGQGDVDESDHVGARVEEEEATRRAIALVRTLPPDQAEVVLQRVVAGLEAAEVAALLGKSVGSVRVLSHRGLRRLARTLAATAPQTAPSGGHQALRGEEV
ncbi:MAG: RNA polymerase sigma factor [Actinomycetes bacterium]